MPTPPGYVASPETRAKLSAALRGKKKSAKAREAIAAAAKRRWERPEEHERTSAAVRAAMTPEVRAKMSTHGRSKSPTYSTWGAMIKRCHNPKDASYPLYGGRGIEVCREWRASFENFLGDMGERPRGLTLDRIDNDGNYESGNCRWATTSEQMLNRRKWQLPARDATGRFTNAR